jgi:hypothetical protein
VETLPDPPVNPDEPVDPTAAAFGDGLLDDLGSEEETLPIDKVIEELQGPDLQDPNHTFLHE